MAKIPELKPRSLGISIRASVDSIKAELGKGEVVIRARAQGKTTALLEFIHEYCSGFCYIVTCTPVMREMIRSRYRTDYPHDEVPVVLTLDRLRAEKSSKIYGRPRVWFTDEVWPEECEIEAEELERLTYLGGVGTAYCMDISSKEW